MKKYVFAVSAAVLAVSGAHAQTIDFSSLDLGALTSAVQIGDYLITPALGGSSTPYVVSANGLNVITTDDYWSGDDTFITRVDGGYFNLNSVVVGSTNCCDSALQGISGGTGAVGVTEVSYDLSYLATPDNSPLSVDLGNSFRHVKWVDLDAIRQGYYASFSVSVDAADGAVPEPASWALMLGGFGLIGVTLRSRRTAVSFG